MIIILFKKSAIENTSPSYETYVLSVDDRPLMILSISYTIQQTVLLEIKVCIEYTHYVDMYE